MTKKKMPKNAPWAEHPGRDFGEEEAPSGLQKVGTAGTAGAGQITFGWTK